ncbi:hypothetical protein [Nocardia crassostreae]|uniref:hypothetical protein n=1 Tax=Nocardia crassostreae TaxID=53428 RepID=UPI001FE0AB35|nr:hypothetical protein [Nocardia crassostreae]
MQAHTYLGKRVAGLDDAEVAAAKRGTSADPKQAAALAAGWTEEQVLEMVALVALQTLTNYVNKVAGTENDWPEA